MDLHSAFSLSILSTFYSTLSFLFVRVDSIALVAARASRVAKLASRVAKLASSCFAKFEPRLAKLTCRFAKIESRFAKLTCKLAAWRWLVRSFLAICIELVLACDRIKHFRPNHRVLRCANRFLHAHVNMQNSAKHFFSPPTARALQLPSHFAADYYF